MRCPVDDTTGLEKLLKLFYGMRAAAAEAR